jgi:hypothetical protein
MKTAAAKWMTGLLVMGLYLIPPSHAHTPLVSCYDNPEAVTRLHSLKRRTPCLKKY